MIPVLLLIGLVVVLLTWLVTTINRHSHTATTGRPSITGGRPPSEPFNSTAKYRTKDGKHDYSFRFHHSADGGFRVHILERPNHSRGVANSPTPHVLHDSAGQYICWSLPIATYEDAKEIARRWAEATEEYRKTGKIF